MQDNQFPAASSRDVQESAASNSRFMSRVFGWMSGGVLLTALTALEVSSSETMVQLIFGNRLLFWALIIAQIGSVVVISRWISKLSTFSAGALYFAYSVLVGVTLSSIFYLYTRESIASTFGITGFAFAGLSAFGFMTKRDLGPLGYFCTMGLFGLVGWYLLSIFFPSMMAGAFSTTTAILGVVIFSGLTAYDSQKIKSFNSQSVEGSEENKKGAILGALILYLDFINLFMSLLRLMGRRR